ncbi:MAG TPA: DUF1801 domain-containing protein [Paracoccaceae bacterium]|nr:DUF1801 domain-containing protein [Paracoccaceae bacterium]HMO70512.1 DUF1801 domain-containing protein [Paracoccaceae bacterium]
MAGPDTPPPREPRPRKRWVPKSPLPPLAPGEVRLLAGGNPQVPKGDGPGPVAAYIAAMPGWKRAVGERLDALVVAAAPGAARAVRWNAPFWGTPGKGWFLSLSCTTQYVKVAWHSGADLVPMPPVASKHPRVRYLHLFEDDPVDADRIADWLVQAAGMPGDPLF